jgi:hypothetical protein
MQKRLMAAVFALVMALNTASAFDDAGTNQIRDIAIRPTGDAVLFGTSWNDRRDCVGYGYPQIGMVILPREHPGFAGLFALALSARTTAEPLRVFTDGCVSDSLLGINLPRVTSVTF